MFRDNNGYKQRLGSLIPKRRQISDLFPWTRVLKWGRKRDKTMEKETRHQRRHDSLHCPRVKCNWIFTGRHSGKNKQMTNWSVSTFKGKLKLFRFKIVKYKTRAFNRKIEIKQIPLLISLTANNHFWCCCPFFAADLMHNSTGYVVKQLVHAFSCALSRYRALGKPV